MLRVISANLNGIRSASGKGFFDWLALQQASVVGVQEVKAQREQIDGVFCTAGPLKGHFHCAVRKGYSGVGLYTAAEPTAVISGIGDRAFDDEGRYVEARYDTRDRKLSIVSIYFPSGSSGEARQAAKIRFLDLLYPHLVALQQEREIILMGDINIAHQEIDLKNWRSNQKNAGFTPAERAWMTRLIGEAGMVDVYRHLHPCTSDECYTWWSSRGQAYANNVGWRLDYQIATRGVAALARRATVYKERRFSDHAPLIIDYEMAL